MSQHPSLSSSDKDKKHRSVLKRYERIKLLKEKEKWEGKKDSVYGLPKVKIIRFKIKKEKAAAAAAEGAEGTAPAAPGAAPAAPGAAPAKPAPGSAPAKPAASEPKKPAK